MKGLNIWLDPPTPASLGFFHSLINLEQHIELKGRVNCVHSQPGIPLHLHAVKSFLVLTQIGRVKCSIPLSAMAWIIQPLQGSAVSYLYPGSTQTALRHNFSTYSPTQTRAGTKTSSADSLLKSV